MHRAGMVVENTLHIPPGRTGWNRQLLLWHMEISRGLKLKPPGALSLRFRWGL